MTATLSRRSVLTTAVAAAAGAALPGAGLAIDIANLPPVQDDYTFENEMDGRFCPDSDAIGDRITAARKAKGLSREAFACCLDCVNPNHGLATLELIEGGNFPEWDDVPTIEAVLGVPISTLIFGGSELAQVREGVRDCLAEFQPSDEVKPDRYLSGCCKRVKQLRERAGLSVAQAAKRFGVDEREWLLWEAGKSPHAMETARLSQFFGVSMEWLTFGKERPIA
jgi:transcriptional regulator with XRE-family HTH domain